MLISSLHRYAARTSAGLSLPPDWPQLGALAMALMVVSWRRRRTHARSSGTTVGLLILMVGAGALAAGAATAGWPWLGVFQRRTIGSYLVWLPMLAAIARREHQ